MERDRRLRRLFEGGGGYWFWLAPGAPRYGDAYDAGRSRGGAEPRRKVMQPPLTLDFAGPAAEALLQHAVLPAPWLHAYLALERPAPGETWEPWLFRLRHFASTYLPIRYAARLGSAPRDRETDQRLELLVLSSEQDLWSELAAAGPSEESPLASLVLGARNPLRLHGSERAAWDAEYGETLKALGATWFDLPAWPRRDAMALHVASFYLPLGLPPDEPRFEDAAHERALPPHVAEVVHPDVARLAACWLALAGADRDSAGVPVAPWGARPRNYAGRTLAEWLILKESR